MPYINRVIRGLLQPHVAARSNDAWRAQSLNLRLTEEGLDDAPNPHMPVPRSQIGRTTEVGSPSGSPLTCMIPPMPCAIRASQLKDHRSAVFLGTFDPLVRRWRRLLFAPSIPEIEALIPAATLHGASRQAEFHHILGRRSPWDWRAR